MSRKEYLSNKEIAERLGLSKRTVEKHLEIALQQIRHCLDPFFFIIFMLFLA
jgi:RNA polymerase sigma-70 factor (ECF subfamily)